MAPETWDSEDEKRTGRKRPDVSRLASCWQVLEEDLEPAMETEFQRAEDELEREHASASSKIDSKAKDLETKLQQRAQAAEKKLDPTKAKQHRSMAWEVINAAEGIKDRRQKAKATRSSLAKRRARSTRELIRRALGPDPSSAASNIICQSWLPDHEAIEALSPAESLQEVTEAVRKCYRILQVVALRPIDPATLPKTMPDQAGDPSSPTGSQVVGSQASNAWFSNSAKLGPSSEENAEKTSLTAASESAVFAMRTCLQHLAEKLQKERANQPQVDPELNTIAKDLDKLSKDEKRDMLMFEGQQENDFNRAITNRVKDQSKRRHTHSSAHLERIGTVLQRRWQRQHDKDKARTMACLLTIVEVLNQSETKMEAIRKEHRDRAGEEADQMENERRRMQEQMQVLTKAALIIRQEKARMAEGWAAPNPQKKQKLMFQSLRIIRRLNKDMKSFPVLQEFQQKHSVLLYSLRMLEARLRGECTGHTDADILEGEIEITAAQAEQLKQAEESHEEQLQAELDALRESHRSKCNRAIAREAARCREEVEAELLPAMQAARAAQEAALQSANMADFAMDLLRPLALCWSRLGVEAFRHSEVAKGDFEPAGFGPVKKRMVNALDATLQALADLKPVLENTRSTEGPQPAGEERKDREWTAALSKAEDGWRRFCEEHPISSLSDEQDTPRGGGDSPNISKMDNTLQIDDLEETVDNISPKSGGRNARGGGAGASNRPGTGAGPKAAPKPAPPPKRAQNKAPMPAPNRPPSAGGTRAPPPNRPPSAGGTGPPGSRPGASRPGTGAGKAAGAGGDKKGAEILAKLDAISKNMDSAFSSSIRKGGGNTNLPAAPGGGRGGRAAPKGAW
eukprot:TRINITY_DN12713_c1_g4_i1.p1 TRINITY_DN12713_c1_g4~~TRINITY_DN12713_c1_g4_i1.p1  ORF type:complete len:882 (+),score=219.77 TRINITY_DN12713_c1_g4_i1:81-2648(+)